MGVERHAVPIRVVMIPSSSSAACSAPSTCAARGACANARYARGRSASGITRTMDPSPPAQKGAPWRANTASMPRRIRSPSAFRRATAARSYSSMAASPATMVSGLATVVPPESTAGGPVVGSSSAIRSARPPTAPMGSPPPMIFPSTVRSGVPPYRSCPPAYPRRKLTTSS